MPDILLACSSKRSSALYRYFDAIRQNVLLDAELISFSTPSFIAFDAATLDRATVRQGLYYHYHRKQQKLGMQRFPHWLWRVYRRLLAFSYRIQYGRFVSILMQRQPKFVCLWNPQRFSESALALAAKHAGIPCIFFENGALPNTTTMDFNGVNYFNSVPREPDFFRALTKPQQDFASGTIPMREAHDKKKHLYAPASKLPTRYFFFPFQVNFDTQIVVHSPHFPTMEIFFESICQLATRLPRENFVVKVHPSDPRDYHELGEMALPGNIQFANNSTDELIRHCAAVVTINSSVGLEAIMLNKKVITLGECFYALPGLTLQATSVDEIVVHLQGLDVWQVDAALRNNFLAYLREDYYLPGSWKNPDAEHFHKINKKIQTRLMQLENTPDSV